MAVTKETEAGPLQQGHANEVVNKSHNDVRSASDLDTCLTSDPSKTTIEPQGQVSCKPREDDQLRRERRLMKNREAARECRRKKKEYVKCLENRVAVLENQNKTLIEELKVFKDIYRHKDQ